MNATMRFFEDADNRTCCEHMLVGNSFTIRHGHSEELETLRRLPRNEVYAFCQGNWCNNTAINERYFAESFVQVTLFLYVMVLLVGVPGNVLTCTVIILRKHMRRSIHYYTFNLVVADLAILLVYAPTQMIFTYNQANWLIGSAMCTVSNLVIPLNLSASIGTLIAISFDRHRGLTKPFKWRAQSLMNAKRTIPVIWIMSIGLTFPLFHFSKLQDNICMENWPSHGSELAYWSVILAAQYVIPFAIIVVIHLRMIHVMSTGKLTIYTLHMRMVKMVIGLLTVYAVCNGMQHAMFYWNFFGNVVFRTSYGAYIFIVSNLLIVIQAAVNPFIYGATRVDFKRAYTGLIVSLSGRLRALISRGKQDGYSFTHKRSIPESDACMANSAAYRDSDCEMTSTPKLFRNTYLLSVRNGNLAPPSMCDEVSYERNQRGHRLETLAFLNPGDLPKEVNGIRYSSRSIGWHICGFRLRDFKKMSQSQPSSNTAPGIIITEFGSFADDRCETSSRVADPAFAAELDASTRSPQRNELAILQGCYLASQSNVKSYERFSDANLSKARTSVPHVKFRTDTLDFVSDDDMLLPTYRDDVKYDCVGNTQETMRPKQSSNPNVILISYRQSRIIEVLNNCPETYI